MPAWVARHQRQHGAAALKLTAPPVTISKMSRATASWSGGCRARHRARARSSRGRRTFGIGLVRDGDAFELRPAEATEIAVHRLPAFQPEAPSRHPSARRRRWCRSAHPPTRWVASLPETVIMSASARSSSGVGVKLRRSRRRLRGEQEERLGDAGGIDEPRRHGPLRAVISAAGARLRTGIFPSRQLRAISFELGAAGRRPLERGP